MKTTAFTVPVISISEVNAAAGRSSADNLFHVSKNTELSLDPKYLRHPVRADSHAFFLATKGIINIKYNLIDYALTPGTLFLLAPGVIHEIHIEEGAEVLTIGFSQEFLAHSMLHKKHMETFQFLASQSEPLLALEAEEANYLCDLILLLRKIYAYTNHPFKEDVLFHGFNLFMLEVAALFKKYRYLDSVHVTRREEILMRFVKLLSIHFREERSVQYYAAQMFVTPRHLTKMVKELSGKTCGELIDEMVISEAKILLDEPARSVANVADQLHFSDQFFFSKFFKHHTGLSPSQYKASAM